MARVPLLAKGDEHAVMHWAPIIETEGLLREYLKHYRQVFLDPEAYGSPRSIEDTDRMFGAIQHLRSLIQEIEQAPYVRYQGSVAIARHQLPARYTPHAPAVLFAVEDEEMLFIMIMSMAVLFLWAVARFFIARLFRQRGRPVSAGGGPVIQEVDEARPFLAACPHVALLGALPSHVLGGEVAYCYHCSMKKAKKPCTTFAEKLFLDALAIVSAMYKEEEERGWAPTHL
jgi:hypothetical protein